MSARSRPPEPGLATLFAYGLPALPLAILALPFYVLVPAFYAQALALPIAAVGQTLLAVRLIDAASDPVVGILADRWRPAFGRRRLWIVVSAPVVAFAAWRIFVPREGAGLIDLFAWGAALSVAWTSLQIPYGAWGAELSRSYAGRTKVVAWREAFAVVGTVLALAAPTVLPALGVTGERVVLAAFAIALAATLPASALLLVLVVPEPQDRSRGRLAIRAGLAHMAANRPFRRLAAAFLVNGLANGLPATLFLFFVQSRLAAPDAAGPLLVLYFVCGIAGVPVWLILARRASKHAAWAAGMAVASGAFIVAPFLGSGDVAAFAVVVVVTGFALGADVVLPASMQADVIELDAAQSGQERAGLYLAVWALASKLALAGAVGVAFPLLGAAGFDPAAGRATPQGLDALAWLYAGLPVLLKLAAIVLIATYPLDAAAQEKARRTLESWAGGDARTL